jgi:diadenylate cyclase
VPTRIQDYVDILIIAYVVYRLFVWIRGTRAVQLIKGIIVLIGAMLLAEYFKLYTIRWILANLQTMLLVALPVVFQPELRRALEQIGRGRFFSQSLSSLPEEDMSKVIQEIIKAVKVLARNKIGALIVIERETGLNDYVESGIRINGILSSEFLINIFIPNTPLHDGAVIVRGDRVLAAGCFLPLTDSQDLSTELGTRHRAAIGITENSDAVVVVVSEETGILSLANDGKLTRYLDETTLKEMLVELCMTGDGNGSYRFWQRRKP